MKNFAEVLHKLFTEKKQTLALAESCTGGMLSHLITQVPGASDYFLGSLVTYSNSLKENLLHVSPQTLLAYGAVSKECVFEMLEGVFKATSADVALAVTGIAGPSGATVEKPLGTIWVALGERGGDPYLFSLKLEGDRQEIIELCSYKLLTILYRFLHEGTRTL